MERRQLEVRIATSAVRRTDAKQRLVYGEVYVPFDPVDGQTYALDELTRRSDTYATFMRGDTLRQLAHDYLQFCRNVDRMHDRRTRAGDPVESFVARAGDPDFTPGAWVIAVRVAPDQWPDVVDGKLNAFSFDVLSSRKRTPLRVEGRGRTGDLTGVDHYPYIPRQVNVDGAATLRLDELQNPSPNFVSLVDRGSNRRQFEVRAAQLPLEECRQDLAILLRAGMPYDRVAGLPEQEVRALAADLRPTLVQVPAAEHRDDDGRWVTLEGGTHVHLGDDGKIDKGPDHFVGRKPSELPSSPKAQAAAAPKPVPPPQDAPKTSPTAPAPPAAAPAPAAAFANSPKGEAQAEAFAREKFGAWADKLTDSQNNALDTYRSKEFKAINGALRDGKLSASTAKTVAKIESTMTTAKEPFVVHRGMNIDPSKLQVGATVEDHAFVSTSLAPRIASGFRHDGVMFEITVKPGAKFAPIAGREGQGLLKEHEILLDRNTKMKITGHRIEKVKGRLGTQKVHTYTVEVG